MEFSTGEQDYNKSRKLCWIDAIFRIVITLVILFLWMTIMWRFSSTPSYDAEEARRNIATTGGVVFGVIMHNAYRRGSDRWFEAPDFDGVKQAIEKTGELFPRYAVVLYENDSEDQTVYKMRTWASQNKRVHFESEHLKRKRAYDSGARTEWLAQYRNKLLDVIMSKGYDWADYVVLLDQDIQPWSAEAVLSTFASQSDNAGHKVDFDGWDKICGNRVETAGSLSDLYAFRDSRWPGPWHRENIPAMWQYCYWPFDGPLVPVTACFGSWAIYRRDALHGCRYSGHDRHNHTECEHVVLDQCMNAHQHTRQYLSPKVVVHTAGVNRLLYPLLQTLGIGDIAHGQNVPWRLMQCVALSLLGVGGMVVAWSAAAYGVNRLMQTPKYTKLDQSDGMESE